MAVRDYRSCYPGSWDGKRNRSARSKAWIRKEVDEWMRTRLGGGRRQKVTWSLLAMILFWVKSDPSRHYSDRCVGVERRICHYGIFPTDLTGLLLADSLTGR